MNGIVATKNYDKRVLLIEMKDKTNSFTDSLLTSLESWLDHAIIDKQIHSIILTGSGTIFSVGGDLNEMAEEITKGDPAGYVDRIVPKINRVIKKIVTHPLPVIAAINGSAAGGGLSLALSCDYKISVPNAKLAFAFSALDLTPDSGSTFTFVKGFGYSKALMNILTSEVILAEDAIKSDAIDEIATPETLMDKAINYSSKLSHVDRGVIIRTKNLLNSRFYEKIDDQLLLEYKYIKQSSRAPSFAKKLNIVLGNKIK
ncbi:MAG: enoyl-CoA hydratase/isomerase family protein [Candidatus Kariarchaeaceae archaeon]|jgi:2-(1,2-epoxy-1,2-dihydrophenyl)acetyl-CoA isomerase